MRSIGRAFDRQSSSVFSVISPTGGIRPPDRRRGSSALSLSEHEEISRGSIHPSAFEAEKNLTPTLRGLAHPVLNGQEALLAAGCDANNDKGAEFIIAQWSI